jgi:hypothetical protein
MKTKNLSLQENLHINILIQEEIILPQGLKFFDLLKLISEWVAKLAIRLIILYVTELDLRLYSDLKKVGWRIACRHKRSLKTPFGQVDFKYRQIQKDGQYWSPLLDCLGIPPKVRIIGECFETALSACLFTSFKKAWECSGRLISMGSLWGRFQDWGEKARQMERQAVQYFTEGNIVKETSSYQLALVMIDGNWVRKKGKKKHFEIKGARLALGKDGEEGWDWTDPILYADNCTSSKFLKDCSNIFNAVYGLHNVPHIVVVSDAASWIKKFCEFYPQAIHQADWWHLWKQVKTLNFFGNEVYSEAWDLLNVERLDDAVNLIRGIKDDLTDFISLTDNREIPDKASFKKFAQKEKAWLKRRMDDLDALISYLLNNRESIYGVKKLPPDIPAEAIVWGSGPIEKLMGTLIGYRMKRQGKSWSTQGASHMSCLLANWYNDSGYNEAICDLSQQLIDWENTNKTLEKDYNILFEGSSKEIKYSSCYDVDLPILRRGKKDTGMLDLLKRIKNGAVISVA